MTGTLRTALLILLIVYFYIVYKLLKKKKLSLKYSLLWLLMGVLLLLMVIFPGILDFLIHSIGIYDTMNGLFTFAIGFVLMLLMALTSIVSDQSDRIKNLVQDNALLERRIRELEEKNK